MLFRQISVWVMVQVRFALLHLVMRVKERNISTFNPIIAESEKSENGDVRVRKDLTRWDIQNKRKNVF